MDPVGNEMIEESLSGLPDYIVSKIFKNMSLIKMKSLIGVSKNFKKVGEVRFTKKQKLLNELMIKARETKKKISLDKNFFEIIDKNNNIHLMRITKNDVIEIETPIELQNRAVQLDNDHQGLALMNNNEVVRWNGLVVLESINDIKLLGHFDLTKIIYLDIHDNIIWAEFGEEPIIQPTNLTNIIKLNQEFILDDQGHFYHWTLEGIDDNPWIDKFIIDFESVTTNYVILLDNIGQVSVWAENENEIFEPLLVPSFVEDIISISGFLMDSSFEVTAVNFNGEIFSWTYYCDALDKFYFNDFNWDIKKKDKYLITQKSFGFDYDNFLLIKRNGDVELKIVKDEKVRTYNYPELI